MRHSAHLEYHALRFDDAIEAAAYVAALSRFLSSPQGRAEQWGKSHVEVWRYTSLSGKPAHVFLNAAALSAASVAFGVPPIFEVLRKDQIPAGAMLVLDSRNVSPLGLNDVMRSAF